MALQLFRNLFRNITCRSARRQFESEEDGLCFAKI